MTTNNNTQLAQPQAGPIAQQLVKMQANGQQALSNGQQPSARQLQKRTSKRTGFSGKTLWDWLPLLIQLLTALALPIALFLATQWLNAQQSQTSGLAAATRYANDQQLAKDQQRETTLKTYLDDMSDLLLNHNLRKSKPGDEVSQVARERTLTTLRRLDANRNGIVLQFLQDAHLIGVKNAVIDLSNADLSGDALIDAYLSGTDLSDANLLFADLGGANLSHTNLSHTNLSGARLVLADLSHADLSHADLSSAHLSGADLWGADLSGARVTQEQLATAKSLKSAIMPDGSKHP